jgi:hypothetical protein
MAISPTIQLLGKSGTVKRISAKDIMGDMAADAVWYSAAASTISAVPYTLVNSSKEWLAWEHGNDITMKFTPDPSGSDGQGFGSQSPVATWTVTAVTGTVYIVRRKYISQADSHADAFKSPNRQTAKVGDSLYPGDALLCAKSGSSFEFKISVPENLAGGQYVMLGAVQLLSAE